MKKYLDQNGNLTDNYYGYIYVTLDKKHNLVYIGQKMGFAEDTEGYFGSGTWIKRIIKKRGSYFLKKVILGVCYTREELLKCETECKYFFNAWDKLYGYNIAKRDNGGDNFTYHPNKEQIRLNYSNAQKGHYVKQSTREKIVKTRKERNNYKHTEETKKKLSASHIGQVPGNKGKPISEEKRQKMKNNAKINPNFGMSGKHHSEESKKKSSISNKGLKRSDECKKNVSEAHKNIFYNRCRLTFEDLKKLINLYFENKSVKEIMSIYKISRNSVRTYTKRLDLPFFKFKKEKIEWLSFHTPEEFYAKIPK